MDKKQSGQKGGFTKWARIPKEKRSEIMRKVAMARYDKEKQERTVS